MNTRRQTSQDKLVQALLTECNTDAKVSYTDADLSWVHTIRVKAAEVDGKRDCSVGHKRYLCSSGCACSRQDDGSALSQRWRDVNDLYDRWTERIGGDCLRQRETDTPHILVSIDLHDGRENELLACINAYMVLLSYLWETLLRLNKNDLQNSLCAAWRAPLKQKSTPRC